MRFAAAPLTVSIALAAGVAVSQANAAEYVFGSARSCVEAGKLTAELCANAEANSAAEFDEKVVRFDSRSACEQAFPRERELGFQHVAGGPASKSGAYFTPRQEGFRVIARSSQDMTATPISAGLRFTPRSILRRDTHVDPDIVRQSGRAIAAGSRPNGGFGFAEPNGIGGAPPPSPPLNSNFDCASYLEPGAASDGEVHCYPTSRR